MSNDAALSNQDIQIKVNAKMDEYKNLAILEQYAIFMGKAQILELGLKRLLTRKFNVLPNNMENWTLGKTKNELRDRGLRLDFIYLLGRTIDYRNYMAHEFLANSVATQSIANFSDRMLYGDLFKSLYDIEQIIIIYDWCEERDDWLQRT